MQSEPVAVTLLVIQAMETLDVPYLIGGSLASAVHGVVRTTLDTDLVADLSPEHAAPLVRALGDAFYADASAIEDAINRRSSFNLIHLETMFKVDVFIPKQRAFDREQFERRAEQVIATDPERMAYVASAEDIILAKLEWYQTGGQVSERQCGIIESSMRLTNPSNPCAFVDADVLFAKVAAPGKHCEC